MKEQDRRTEGLVIFSPVANTVLFVNPNVHSPLQLKVGEPSPLGIFADRVYRPPALDSQNSKERGQILRVWPSHDRSIVVGRAFFADRTGRVYRDIDLKGTGDARASATQAYISPSGKSWGVGNRRGLLNRDTAFPTWERAEEFVQAGIRTYRILAIIGLEELIVGGKIISMEEARKKKIVNRQFHPVVEVRAFGTKARIQDLQFSPDSTKQSLIEDAKQLVAKEQGLPLFSDEEYALWFAKTLGRNVGLMHDKGWVHGYLTPHNITLDCCIVDLDSVKEASSAEGREYDRKSTINTIVSLLHYISRKDSFMREAVSKFEEEYSRALEESSEAARVF